MFCPGCGYQASDDLKYCRQCGANLRGLREAINSPPPEEKPDWSNTWAANILLAKQLQEQLRGSPEERRIKEIKGGVITSFVGIGLMIFLYFFLNVVANQENNPRDTAEILRSVWMVGIIPFLIGIGIIFNGLVISRRLLQPKEQETQSAKPASLTLSANPTSLPAKTTDQLSAAPSPADFSVIEEPTEHFPEPVIEPSHRKSGR